MAMRKLRKSLQKKNLNEMKLGLKASIEIEKIRVHTT